MLSWGDIADGDDSDASDSDGVIELPLPTTVTDANGVTTKTVYKHHTNEDTGQLEIRKIVTVSRAKLANKRISKAAIERRKRLASRATGQFSSSFCKLTSMEWTLETLNTPKTPASDKLSGLKRPADSSQLSLGERMKRNFAKVRERTMTNQGLNPTANEGNDAPTLPTPSTKMYRPPGWRADGPRRADDGEEPTLRIHNLCEDASLNDVRNLLRRFNFNQVRLPRSGWTEEERQLGKNRGFAFVTFHTRKEAEKCIKVMDGYGYGNQILKVGFAKPRKDEGRAKSTKPPSFLSGGSGSGGGSGVYRPWKKR